MDDFKIRIINDIAIVIVDTIVATRRNAKPLWDELDSKSILDWDKVIIDISTCTFIDSTFLGVIVKIHRRINKSNGQLKLVFPEKNAMKYLHTIGIITMIDCFNTIHQAINSFDTDIPLRKISFEKELPEDYPSEPLKFKLG